MKSLLLVFLCLTSFFFQTIFSLPTSTPNRSSKSPAFLVSAPEDRLLSQRIADRNRIEDDRGKHGYHLGVQTMTALGSSAIGVAKSYLQYTCTSKSCPKEKEAAKERYLHAKKTFMEPVKANHNAAVNVWQRAQQNKAVLAKHYNQVLQLEHNGGVIPHHLTEMYSDVSNRKAREDFDNERSHNWEKGQSISRAARNPKM